MGCATCLDLHSGVHHRDTEDTEKESRKANAQLVLSKWDADARGSSWINWFSPVLDPRDQRSSSKATFCNCGITILCELRVCNEKMPGKILASLRRISVYQCI